MKIIGIIWVLTGFSGILRPGAFKKRLQRKFSRKMRVTVLLFLLVLGFMLAGNVFKTDSSITLLAGIVGAAIVIKVILAITNKTTERLFDWMRNRSVNFFRIWAGVIFILGIMFFLG
jgi:hypothetical protein